MSSALQGWPEEEFAYLPLAFLPLAFPMHFLPLQTLLSL